MRKNIIELFLVFFLNLPAHAYAQDFYQKPSNAEFIKTSSIGLAGFALHWGLSSIKTPEWAWV